ncbi:hypothetical protein [Kribbella soli]|uniref:Uncharacterized protein n=1 Tax=Kribbella soli TaxID=1124743 RepID=A0A4R0H8S2_9ACTN|nr:hypothetical protein [Kribbella soli]TCC04982.1 hypothetical protein E0H45_23185 [Kribbella soli]
MTSAASTANSPQVRAREALGLAVGVVAPEALALRDGTLRLRHSRERLARKALRRLERRLARRATAVGDDRLVAEAVAFVGAELDLVRGGTAADGATAGLDALLDLPGLPAVQQREAQALLQDLLDGNRLETEADLRRLTSTRARQEGSNRPFAADLVANARSLAHDAERLAQPQPQPATLRTPGRSRRPVGGGHQTSGGVGRPAAGGFFGPIRRLLSDIRTSAGAHRAVRDRRAEAQYEEFRRLSVEWRDTRAGLGVRALADVETDLTNLSGAIRHGGHPAPSVPWTGVQVVVPDAQQAPATTPEERFQARVRRQIADLDSAAADHLHRADVRTLSAAAARDQAAELFAAADDEAGARDASASERARRLRVRAVARLRVADRHTEIASLCTAAANQARTAAEAYRALSPAGGNAEAAVREVRAYEEATAATLPAKDVQHNGLPSGRLPHLTKLCKELNEALEKRKVPYSFTPDVLHRTLRGESRRILSPDGFVLTIGNDARTDADHLLQFHLQLDPGELHEVLDSPLTIDEAQVGQVVQGGFSVATAAAQNSATTADASLRTVTQALPDSSKLKAVAAFVAPGVELSRGRGRTVTGGATEFAQTGAVEALRGEFLRYRSDRPRWIWRIRESATADWSPPNVVDTGADHDAATLDLGYIHTYTVPPPTETTDLETLGLAAERRTAMPEHMATRVDGLNDLCDRTLAELQHRLGSLDRVGHDRVRSLVVEDGMIRLDETTRPGGVWRLITDGGRPVAWAQLETDVDLESAELTSDSSPDHKLELWRVGNSGASGSQSFSRSRTAGLTATTSISDLGSTTADIAPGVHAGRNTSHEDTASTADLGSRWSTQRVAPTVGVKLRLRHKVTVHRLDRDDSFTTEGAGDACLRMAERDAFRYGLPVPAAALLRDADGAVRRGSDGQLLLRGDPRPTDTPLQLPPWLGNGPGQLRGAGPAMIRELTGADDALKGFLTHLSQQGMIPPLDDHGHPLPAALAGQDPAVVLSQAENWERACQQIAKHRLETGYDHAAQDRLRFQLTEHRTGHPPRVRTYQIALEQHFDRVTPIGVADNDMVVNVDIGVSTSGRTGSRAQSVPWSARLGLSNAPATGDAGTTPTAGVSVGRTSRGRSLGWSSTRGAYRMTVAESGSTVAVFDVPHTITVSEVTSDGTAVPVASSEGSARVWLDSEFCGTAQPTVAVPGRVKAKLLQTAAVHHIDARDPIAQLTAAVPGLEGSSALQHLSGFLAPRNLIARPELLTTEYRTSLAVGSEPSDPLEAIRQRGLTPRPTALTVTTRVENLRYVGAGHPILAELNVTLATTGSTAGVSTATSAGINGGSGAVSADGQSYGGSVGLTRTTTVSSSASESATTGVERTLMRDGQHYQFWGDLVLEAQLRSGGAAPRRIPLENGAVLLTLPERDALLSYGRRDLDLPLHQVSDAVERVLNGNLVLPRRTMTALMRRYRIDKRGATGGLAAAHTHEVLADAVRTAAGLPAHTDQRLDAVLAQAEDLARRRVEPQLPRHYDRMMGAAQVDQASLQDQDGNDTDPFREVCAAVAEHSPQALDDPVLVDALRGELAGTRWRNQLDDMLDPRGFVLERPVRIGASTRNLRVRVRLRFVGQQSTEAGGTQGQSGSGFGLAQLWSLRDRSRSRTEGTSYGASLDLSGSDGIPATAGAGAELNTSTTAASTEAGTQISTALAVETARVERDYQLFIEIEDSATPGGTADSTTRREAHGRMSLAVPASVLDSAPPQLGLEIPDHTDHRPVVLPEHYFAEGTLPYLPGAEEDNALFEAACARLGEVDLLKPEGVRMHASTLESRLGGANRMVAFQEMAGPSGHELVPLAVPGDSARVVAIRVRAEVSGLELLSDPDEESTTQLGQNSRALRVSQVTARSNRLLPGSRTIGTSTPGGELSVSTTSSRRVSEQDTGTVGARHETGLYESGQVVTVKVRVDYHLDFERLRLGRRKQPKVERSATLRRAASGEAYLTMYRHEYDEMRARMESGGAARTSSAGSARPERVRTVQVTVDADEQHPYRPLVDALDQARREDVNVRLAVREANGRRTVYVAHPDGTMAGRGDRGFAAAFATLHPRLALLAEGRVDLRALHTPDAPPRRFTSAVVEALQQHGIPAAALAETDSRMSHTRTAKASMRRSHTANPATGMTIE